MRSLYETDKKYWWKVLLTVILAFIGVVFWYLTDVYSAKNPANVLESSDHVQVEIKDFGFAFDGPERKKALIFTRVLKWMNLPMRHFSRK
ncbi:hypothetical protein D3X11_03315 [Streptococcus sp. X16XC17]|nr:hypothetical protein D3X11_03315 [Streptococcus sp. X16XC17]